MMTLSRMLVIRWPDGREAPFEITLGPVHQMDSDRFYCLIDSGNVIFDGAKKIYGVDGIDCIDQAIHMIDLLVESFAEGAILWPDGGAYRRVPTDRKMIWG